MYGTIFRMKPKPGETEALFEFQDQWVKERSPDVKGFVAAYLLEAEDGDLLGVAIFEDRESYQANADDPAQDEWYQKMRAHLIADPEWNDGIIRSWTKP